MRIKAEVYSQESVGDAVIVTFCNGRPARSGRMAEYNPPIKIRVRNSQAKSYPAGRRVFLTIKAR